MDQRDDASSLIPHSGGPVESSRPRRAPVACKRCRRLRGRCIHEGPRPPCKACREAGSVEAGKCLFPSRGDNGEDRQFRRKRAKRSHGVVQQDARIHPLIVSKDATPKLRQEDLPPHEEIIEGCRVFWTSYFQLGFIPKALFLEQLTQSPDSISRFLILSILSLSSRFTPSLVKRYGGQVKATDFFIDLAAQMVPEEMYKPSLHRIQGFFLLGIAEWGNGDRNRSSIHMAIAMKMAGILCFHKEETYQLPENATSDEIVTSEAQRRTFWMLESQDNLHSGHNTPASFSLGDITTLLPCEESDFSFGIIPQERAALFGTRAAAINPLLVSLPSRSLFANLIQAHNLWGQVARRACRDRSGSAGADSEPWSNSSEYAQLTNALREWEDQLPRRHRWSVWNLRGYRTETLDLAYLAVTMSLRLSNIVVRRVHLEEIMGSLLGNSLPDESTRKPFWNNMSLELFQNLLDLYEQIDSFFSHRSSEEGFPAIIVFCVYICGSLASYLWTWPQLCARYAPEAERILHRSLEILDTLQYAWPTAIRWTQALRELVTPADDAMQQPSTASPQQHFLSLDDGVDQVTNAGNFHHVQSPDRNDTENLLVLSDLAARVDHRGEEDPAVGSSIYQDPEDFGLNCNDDFEAELTAFLQGELHMGIFNH